MNFILSLICFVVGWLYSFFIAFVAIPLFLIKNEWGQVCHRLFGQVNLWLMNIDVKIIGLENLKFDGVILAPNHESLFDILVLASLPGPKSWIAKKQVKYIPFIGQVMQAMGSFFVSRDRSERDIRVLGEVESALQAGARVIIFPEGTRTRTGELLPFKKGAFRTAINAGVPLLPIAITGTYEIAPAGKLPSRGHHVVVRIGEPLMPKGGAESVSQLMEEYRNVLVRLLQKDRTN